MGTANKVKVFDCYTEAKNRLPDGLYNKLQYRPSILMRYRRLIQWVVSGEGADYLSNRERGLLVFIINRTVYYGKTAEYVSREQFINGVVDAKGNRVIAGLKWNYKFLYSTIRSLSNLGFITIHKTHVSGRCFSNIYEIALEFIFSLIEGQCSMSALRQPKTARVVNNKGSALNISKKRGVNYDISQVQSSPSSQVQNAPTNILNIEDNKLALLSQSENSDEITKPVYRRITRTRRSAEEIAKSANSIGDVINLAKARSEEIRTEKLLSTNYGARASLQELNAAWKQAMIDVQGAGCSIIISATGREYGRFKQVIKNHHITVSWYDLFVWAISSWSALNDEAKNKVKYFKTTGQYRDGSSEDVVYLGTEKPEISSVLSNITKLLRRYSRDASFVRSANKLEDISILEVKLQEKEKELQFYKKQYGKPVMQNVNSVQVKSVKVKVSVDPVMDDFFKNGTNGLPTWGSSYDDGGKR